MSTAGGIESLQVMLGSLRALPPDWREIPIVRETETELHQAARCSEYSQYTSKLTYVTCTSVQVEYGIRLGAPACLQILECSNFPHRLRGIDALDNSTITTRQVFRLSLREQVLKSRR